MSTMKFLSPDPIRFPFELPAAAGSHYEAEQTSADSTPFASAPSSPSRSKAHDLFYSVPPSPRRGIESFSDSADLQASIPFSWEEALGTRKQTSFALDPEFEFSALVFEDRRALSAPTSPNREYTIGLGMQDQLREASGKVDQSEKVAQDLDSDFRFSSSQFDALSSAQMSSADELFFKGKILPLKQPPRVQGPTQEFAFDHSEKGPSSMSAPPSRTSPRGSGASGAKSVLGLKSSSTESKHENINLRQGWAKGFAPSRLFRKDQRPNAAMEATETAGTSPFSTQQMRKGSDRSKKSAELNLNHLNISDVDDASVQIQNIKALSHVNGRDGQQSHRYLPDLPENIAVKRWYDKDGDKRMKNGAARSWPRPSARSVLATRSSRDTSSSKQGSLAAPLELHYRNNGVTSEQMRRRTFLPYKQSLLGCLGFGNMWVPALSSTLESMGR
ncbi:hypothetical protein O6H91_07G031100 [Diphasiastrum complanatum]|uniref:Uncharacterized protein n=1 Tax=Diphasiastrum complanatum TaxID=34168 RepID=A0ACC2D3Q3_DIPCM|nr:hypothetical protein O6H91_07G031100 [Diphasiastrum complanatum]